MFPLFFFSSRRRHTRLVSNWSSDVCSSDLTLLVVVALGAVAPAEAMTNASAGSLLAYVCATKAGTVKVATSAASCGPNEQRSEERRVGKECRARCSRER